MESLECQDRRQAKENWKTTGARAPDYCGWSSPSQDFGGWEHVWLIVWLESSIVSIVSKSVYAIPITKQAKQAMVSNTCVYTYMIKKKAQHLHTT